MVASSLPPPLPPFPSLLLPLKKLVTPSSLSPPPPPSPLQVDIVLISFSVFLFWSHVPLFFFFFDFFGARTKKSWFWGCPRLWKTRVQPKSLRFRVVWISRIKGFLFLVLRGVRRARFFWISGLWIRLPTLLGFPSHVLQLH